MKFSIIIPVYRAEKYLRLAVDSVINQTYSNLEIVIVDDGSPDNCPIICDELAKKDNRIKVIHQRNGGVSNARNNGIRSSRGDVICFLDADDEWANNYLEELYNLYTQYSDIGGAFTARWDKYPTGEVKLMKINSFSDKYFILDDLFKYFGMCRTSCFSIKRIDLNYIGYFREGVKRGEDADLILREYCYNRIGYINIPLAYYNVDTEFNSASSKAIFYFPYEEWYSYKYPNKNQLVIHTTGLLIDKICKLVKIGLYKEAYSLLLKIKWLKYIYCKCK